MNFFKLVSLHVKMNFSNRGAVVGGIVLPLVLYYFLSQAMKSETFQGISYSQFLLPGVICISLCASAFVGLPVLITTMREQDILKRILTTPYPISKYILVIILSQFTVMLSQSIILLIIGAIVYKLKFTSDFVAWVLFVLLFILGILSLIAFGFAFSNFIKGTQNAVSVGNILNLVLVFLSGGFFPIDSFPKWLKEIAKFSPLYIFLKGQRDFFAYAVSLSNSNLYNSLIKDLGFLFVFGLLCYLVAIFSWKKVN